MYDFFLALWAIVTFVAFPVLVIILIVNLIRKKSRAKAAIALLICVVVSFFSCFGGLLTVPEDMQVEFTTEPATEEITKKQEATTEPTTEKHSHKYVEVEYTPNFNQKKATVKEECSCGDTKTKNVDMSTADISKYLKDNCKTYTYKEIARNPETYKDDLAVFTGEVIQVQELLGTTTLLVNITKEGSEYYTYYTDSVYVDYKFTDELKILNGDIITMYGKLQGEKSYVSVLGQIITTPFVEVYYAELSE